MQHNEQPDEHMGNNGHTSPDEHMERRHSHRRHSQGRRRSRRYSNSERSKMRIMNLKRAGIIFCILAGIFVASFSATCAVLYLSKSSQYLTGTKVMGSLRVERVFGRSIQLGRANRNISEVPLLKNSLEKFLLICLQPLSPLSVEVLSLEEDEMARLLDLTDRGAVVEWNAKIPKDRADLVEETLMNCETDVDFEPESVKIGLENMRSGRTFGTLESFLLVTDEEFDLRNIQFDTVLVPKFDAEDAICPPLEIPRTGSVEPISCTLGDHIFVGMTCRFSCLSNQTIVGNDAITCLSTGSWDYSPPVCSNYCQRLFLVRNGGVYPSSCTTADIINPGMRCFYYCDPSYVLEGSSLTCSTSGIWQGAIPFCRRTCAPMSAPKNGLVSPALCARQRIPVGFVCTFECDRGFTVSGSQSVTCDIDGRWGGTLPTCRKGCPLLRLLSHGSISPGSCSSAVGGREEVLQGLVCIYYCIDGYILQGPDERLCSEGGIWTEHEPECKRICGPVPLLSNMISFPYMCQRFIVVEGTKCDLHCTGDYIMFGEVTSRTCLHDGTWRESDAACYRACPPLMPVFNGKMTPQSCLLGEELIREGMECSLECNNMFFLSGNDKVQCTDTGEWMGELGRCMKRCDKLSVPKAGNISPIECAIDGTYQGMHCEFSCREGHTLEGLRVLSCLSDGNWAGSVPACEPDTHLLIKQKTADHDVCLTANAVTLMVHKQSFEECRITHGLHWWRVTKQGELRSVIMDRCMSASPNVGSSIKMVICNEDDAKQKWEFKGEDHDQSIALKDTNMYMSYGYDSMLSIAMSSQVDEDSLWKFVFSNNTQSLFEDEFGGSCPKLKNSSMIVKPDECVLDRFVANETDCQFSCHIGFKLYGHTNRSCLSGLWSNAYPECRRACEALSAPTNGNVTSTCKKGLQDQSAICKYECDAQHRLVGAAEVMCLSHGEWSYPMPSCIEICPPLNAVTHGTITPSSCLDSSSLNGAACTMTCSIPYLVKGPSTLTCRSDHTWSDNWSCSRGCESEVEHGNSGCDTDPVYEDTQCTYTCNPPRLFTNLLPPVGGTLKRVCQATGFFNESMPHCGMTCLPLNSPANGQFVSPNCTASLINRGIPCVANCTGDLVAEGSKCFVECDAGFKFRGSSPEVVCLSDGQWKNDDYSCEEELQFTLFNDNVYPEVCARMDDYTLGSLLKKDDLLTGDCFYLQAGTLYTWEGDMIKHIVADLCLAVQDLTTESFSLVLVKACDANDASQQWDCEHEYLLRVQSKPLYLSASSSDHSFLIVEDLESTWLKYDFVWKSIPTKNFNSTNVGGPCYTKVRRCAAFDNLPNGAIVPSTCKSGTLHEGTVCNIACNNGYLLHKVFLQSVSVNCLSHGAWRADETLPDDTLPPVCLKRCPPLFDPVNGTIEPAGPCNSGNSSVYGSVCRITCDFLHVVEGADVLVCGEDGTWSHPLPICRMKCFHVPLIFGDHQNAPYTEHPAVRGCMEIYQTHQYTAIMAGVTCSYHCAGGMHTLSGATQRTCEPSGSFDQPVGECHFPVSASYVLSNCPAPPGVPNMTYNCFLNASVPSTERICANYTCEPDYYLNGSSVLHCNVINYTWPDPPVCIRKCKDIGTDCVDIVVGQTCTIHCINRQSYSHGHGVLLCQDEGVWNDTAPTCVGVTDFHIQTIVVAPSKLCLTSAEPPYMNSIVTAKTCSGRARTRWMWRNEYTLMHSASALCLTATGANHGASVYITFCNPANQLQQWQCSTDPAKPLMIKSRFHSALVLATTRALADYVTTSYNIRLVDLKVLDREKYEFTHMFTMLNSMEATLCAARQSDAHCPPLEASVPKGIGFSPSTCLDEWSPEGRPCFWFCEAGQESATHTVTLCQNGRWNATTFSCRRGCPAFNHPQNGNLIDCTPGAESFEGMVCSIECIKNYYSVWEATRVCQWDGTWSGEDFTCAKSCDPLDRPDHIVIEPADCLSDDPRPIMGTLCTYTCMENYHMTTKENTRTCVENAAWSGQETHCVRICSPLPLVTDGSISPSTCSMPPLPVGTVCTIMCDAGYQIMGVNTRECQEDGTWSNILSDNERVCLSQCKPFPIPENSQLSCSFDKSKLSTFPAFYPESTDCQIMCDIDYAIDGSWARTCHGTGAWSGQDAYCYPELQLLIFLSKKNDTEESMKICIAASADDLVVKVEASDCDSYNPFHRWSWFSSVLLKNSGSGKCMGIASPNPGERLKMVSCNSTDTVQEWSCDSDSAEWFLRMHRHHLYPDFGYASVETLWVYDLDLYDDEEDNIMWYSSPASEYKKGADNENLRATVCATRRMNLGGICSSLMQPAHGKIYPSFCSSNDHKISPGLLCSYECEIGYKPDIPETTLTCQENGMWSGAAPKCEAFCGHVNLMPHMVVHPSSCSLNDKDLELSRSKADGVLPGGICTVSCEEGFRLESAAELKITCLENGRWSEEPRECKRICPSIPQMHHTFVTPSLCSIEDQIKDAACSLECDTGFVMDLAQRECPDFSEFNSTLDPNDTTIADNCTDEEKPSIFVQKLTKLCMSDGSWSGDPVQCVSVCPPPVPPWHGQIVPSLCIDSLVKEGAICTYVCDDGFMITGDPSRACRSGAWVLESALVNGDLDEEALFESDEIPVCQRYCNAETKNNSFTFVTPEECNVDKIQVDTSCSTSCHSDYILVGNAKTTCLKDGTWDATPAKCIKKCSALLPLKNGAVFPLACTSASMGSGAICTYSCLGQFSIIGSLSTTCNEAGEWSHPPPECKRRCLPIPKIYNGEATPASCHGEHITVLDVCYFTCRVGFILEGYEMTQCQSDGQWDVPIPKCVRTCPPFSVGNGTVKCTTTHNTWGTKCKILCSDSLTPSSLSVVTCSSSGTWNPKFPTCINAGIPMYIMQPLDGKSVCLMEDDEGSVVRVAKQECLTASELDIKAYQWRWLGRYNIQNTASGRCMSVHFVRGDEPVVTSLCDTGNPLQWWECSTANPFRLLLRNTMYSPSTYIKNSNILVLQLWSDAHSYFSTLSLITLSFSSLCSRRFGSGVGGACPALSDIPGGFVDDVCKRHDVKVGQMCGYECEDSTAVLVGDALTQCMGNGLWMVPPPKCVGGCPMLDDTLPPHTYYVDPTCVFDEPQAGQICTASCLRGYEMRGNPNRTCLGSGLWSQRVFECRKLCPVIFGVLDGTTDPFPCRSISCLFSCHPGYLLEGAKVLTCLDNGEWDKPIPQCIKDAQFQIISLDVRHPSLCVTIEEGAPATKSKCTVGMGSQLFKWIQSSKLLHHPASGLCLTGSSSKWGEIILAYCDDSNSLQIWECGSDPHSHVDSLRIEVWGDNFYLDVGATGGDTRLVMETYYYQSSQWFAKHYFSEGTVCSMRDIGTCPPLVLSSQSRLSPPPCLNHTAVLEGLACTVSCDYGYAIDGVTHTTCLPEGKWTSVPLCKGGYKCEALVFRSPLVHSVPGYCKGGSVSSGETCRFYCDEGFQLQGSKQIGCQDGGTWSGGPPTCVQSCSPLHSPSHTSVDPIWCLGSNNPSKAECRFTCEDGFKLVGSQSRTCKSDGLWSGDDARCLRLCPRLSSPRNGRIFPSRCISDESTDGTTCQFQCDPDYGLDGTKETLCLDGRWTNKNPTCVELNACPAIYSSPGCELKVFYDKLFNDVVVAGTSVTVTCGRYCSLLSEPATRMCLENGSWSGGSPSCKDMCPPVKVPFGVLTRPFDCGYSWKLNGSICEASCARQTESRGVKEITCKDGGRWSAEFDECTKLISDENLLSEPFMILQQNENEVGICLQSNIANRSVISVPADSCDDMDLIQLWVWHGSSRIRSVSAGMCWTPKRRDGEVVLGLEPCSSEHVGQVFSCGNIGSQEHRLHLTSEDMQVWNRGSGSIQMTSYTLGDGLNWEAKFVAEKSWTENDSIPIHQSVCEPLCGGKTTTVSGTFSSPGYPQPYAQNLVCDWTIELPNNYIYLWVHHVAIGQDNAVKDDSHCVGDHLTILDGDDFHLHDSNVLGNICGKQTTNIGPFVSMHGKMAIRFFSDDTPGTGTGFTATWDSEPFPDSLEGCGLTEPLELGATGNGSTAEGRKQKVGGRIVGGKAAEKGQVSWYASLLSLYGQRHLCGATFVRPQYLITAAHCVSGIDESVSEYVVGYGAQHKQLMLNLIKELLSSAGSSATFVKSDDGTTLVRIEQLHFHPHFKDNTDYDIAIIKIAVKSPIIFSAACIPPLSQKGSGYNFGHVEVVKDYCTIAGWDSEKRGGVSGLHYIKLPIVSDYQCQQVSVKSFGREINTTSVLCAAYFDGNQQTVCDGDDGSGLICNWNGNYYVVGIASFQIASCGLLNVPKYFIRVATYQDWIQDVLGDAS